MLIERYLPEVLRNRLGADAASITAPAFISLRGSLLFADISGFTQLAERLAARGPSGAEELTAFLDSCFGELVAIVHAHGGDVLKFAGDALLALWQVETDESDAARRAIACALAVQATLHQRPMRDDVRLSLRVTLGAGEVCLSSVGGVLGRRELLVWGDPLRQLAEARVGTAPGDVSAASEVWDLVRDVAVGTSISASSTRVSKLREERAPRPLQIGPARPDAEAAHLAHIPGAILGRVKDAETRWLGELRRITVMFAKFPSPEAGTSAALVVGRAQSVMAALQTAVYRFEGSVNKISVDEKGIMLLAAWGLPPDSHEDDPARAVRAALAVQTDLRQRELSCSIGIATGNVYCGIIGTPARAEYTVIGDAVNLAARLMDAANASIWCDPTTVQHAAREVTFEPLAPFAAKGKAKLIAVHRPIEVTAARAASGTKLVGREREREAIAALLSSVTETREGGVLVFEGPAGLGKSRLVAHACERAAAGAIPVLIGGGSSVERGTPYFAWRALFTEYFGISPRDTTAERHQRIWERFADDPDRLARAPLLNAVLATNLPETEFTAQMTGEVRADNTHTLLVGLLAITAEMGPLLVILEDCPGSTRRRGSSRGRCNGTPTALR